MSELDAAVGVVQVGRFQGIVDDMRAKKARIKSIALEPLQQKGVEFRKIHDPEGDTSILLIFFLPSRDKVKPVIAALKSEQVPAHIVFSDGEHLPHDSTDLHCYTTWTPILDKHTWSAKGGPWIWHPREVNYSKDMCPRTIDLISRAVSIHISPDLTDDQADQMGAAMVKVIQDTL
jgi:8-amino-3,8-dideoxy-alpha-D-manno-octulosonate transaminase